LKRRDWKRSDQSPVKKESGNTTDTRQEVEEEEEEEEGSGGNHFSRVSLGVGFPFFFSFFCSRCSCGLIPRCLSRSGERT
jgi:hypothetical protein